MKKKFVTFATAAILMGTPALAVDTQNKENVGVKSQEKAAGGLGGEHDKGATGSTTATGSGAVQPPKEPTGSEAEKNQKK